MNQRDSLLLAAAAWAGGALVLSWANNSRLARIEAAHADGGGDIINSFEDADQTDVPGVPNLRRVRILRDPDRAREEANERTVIAAGVELPSGEIVVEWNRSAFEEGERTDHPTRSLYGSVEDAEQASAGTVVFVDGEGSE